MIPRPFYKFPAVRRFSFPWPGRSCCWLCSTSSLRFRSVSPSCSLLLWPFRPAAWRAPRLAHHPALRLVSLHGDEHWHGLLLLLSCMSTHSANICCHTPQRLPRCRLASDWPLAASGPLGLRPRRVHDLHAAASQPASVYIAVECVPDGAPVVIAIAGPPLSPRGRLFHSPQHTRPRLLGGLLLYDVFWVFLSERFFAENVMVVCLKDKCHQGSCRCAGEDTPIVPYPCNPLACLLQEVAVKSADNPVNVVADRIASTSLQLPAIDVPGKLLFPSSRFPGRFNVLGLGDVVMPGLVLGTDPTWSSRSNLVGQRFCDPPPHTHTLRAIGLELTFTPFRPPRRSIQHAL